MKENSPESKKTTPMSVTDINSLSEDWDKELSIRRKRLKFIPTYESDDELTDLIKSIKDKDTILI